jgi:hypothetical protein
MRGKGGFIERLGDRVLDPALSRPWRWALWLLAALLLLDVALGWYWSDEPDQFQVSEHPSDTRGATTTATLIRVAETLLEKPGGYLRNDMLPHQFWLDNMPSWEYGALVQVRDMARSLRRDMSRSQSQSQEDPALAIAEPQFNFDADSWIMPATESEYRRGIRALETYLARLTGKTEGDARFYARADNLSDWLNEVQNRLGSLSLALSKSVGRQELRVPRAAADMPGEAGKAVSGDQEKTPWLKIDNVFYEARGATWALVHLMKGVQEDFAGVLEEKNARTSYRQVIRELEATQATVWSPVILNGSGYGVLANHSLVMANYISRANAALIDLRQLLQQG